MKIILGIVLFLMGIKLLSKEMQKKHLMQVRPKSNFRLLIYGVIITILVQSSSIIICLIMVLVSSNKFSVKSGMYFVMGANIGTTSTALITSFSYSIWIIGLIFCLTLIITKNIKITFSIICFLVGLNLLKGSSNSYYELLSFLLKGKSNFRLGMTTLLVTAMIQSSSLIIVFIQNLYNNSILNYEQIIYILIGINIGTTATAILCSLVLNYKAKAVAYFHLLFNIVGSLIILCIYYVFGVEFRVISSQYDIFFMHLLFNVFATVIMGQILRIVSLSQFD